MTARRLTRFPSPSVLRAPADHLEACALAWINDVRAMHGMGPLPALPAGVPGDLLHSPLCLALGDENAELHDGYLLVHASVDDESFVRRHWLPAEAAAWQRAYEAEPFSRYSHLVCPLTLVAQITGEECAFGVGDLRASCFLHARFLYEDDTFGPTLLSEAVEYGLLTVADDAE